MATRGCEDKSCEQCCEKEDDRVLGHEPEAGECGNPDPPALVFALEQANHAIGCEHPAELFKGSVLKLCSLEERDGRERDSQGGGGDCNAVAAKDSCDEPSGDDDTNLREDREETQTLKRVSKERHRNPLDEWRERWISNVPPVKVESVR